MTRYKAFGQVATQQCLDKTKPFLNRLMFFLIGLALTVLQFIVIAGLLFRPICSAMSNDCPSSQWCPITDKEFGTSRCTRCASTESDFDFMRFYHAAMPDVEDYADRQALRMQTVSCRNGLGKTLQKNPDEFIVADSSVGRRWCWQTVLLADGSASRE